VGEARTTLIMRLWRDQTLSVDHGQTHERWEHLESTEHYSLAPPAGQVASRGPTQPGWRRNQLFICVAQAEFCLLSTVLACRHAVTLGPAGSWKRLRLAREGARQLDGPGDRGPSSLGGGAQSQLGAPCARLNCGLPSGPRPGGAGLATRLISQNSRVFFTTNQPSLVDQLLTRPVITSNASPTSVLA